MPFGMIWERRAMLSVSPRFQNQRKAKVFQGSQQPEAPKSVVGLECGVIYKQFELVLNWFLNILNLGVSVRSEEGGLCL